MQKTRSRGRALQSQRIEQPLAIEARAFVEDEALAFLLKPETTKFQYTDGVADVTRIAPDNWVHDQALLDRPGNKDIQLDLFRDYGTNVPLYPQFQAYFRTHKPPTLIVWGKNDTIFAEAGARIPIFVIFPRRKSTYWILATSRLRTSWM